VVRNAESATEEKHGLVHWLRPEFQSPTGSKAATLERLAATDEPEQAAKRSPHPRGAYRAIPLWNVPTLRGCLSRWRGDGTFLDCRNATRPDLRAAACRKKASALATAQGTEETIRSGTCGAAEWLRGIHAESDVAAGTAAVPWPNRRSDQIPQFAIPAAKAPAARSGEQVAEPIRGANKADIEQILDSLTAPLMPLGTPSGSSGSSDGLDSWAFSSDSHTGRLGYPCR
jgi:hypothetical protein